MIDPETRRQIALQGLVDLGRGLGDHRVLNVQCAHSHHVAAVFETPQGLVYRSLEGPHAHGARDRQDVAHHGAHHGNVYADLLVVDPRDDSLPAWCDCGPRTLSRAMLIEAVEAGGGTFHVQ